MSKWLAFGLLCMALTWAGCKASKTITGAPTRITSKELKKKLSAQSFTYHTLQAKLSISYESPDEKRSFKGDLRVQKDSAIWLSVTPLLGLEVVRVFITPDTVHIIDRLNKQYVREPLSILERQYGLPNDFSLLQALLIGDIYPHFARADTVQFVDSAYRIVQEKDGLHQVLWVEPYSFNLTGLNVHHKASNHALDARFSDYEMVEEQPFAATRLWTVASEDQLAAELGFSRVRINNPLQFTFVVPEKYERVE